MTEKRHVGERSNREQQRKNARKGCNTHGTVGVARICCIKIFKIRSWSLEVIKTVAGPKGTEMRTSGLEGSGRGAVGRCRVRFVGNGNRGAAAGVGGQPAAARRAWGLHPIVVRQRMCMHQEG